MNTREDEVVKEERDENVVHVETQQNEEHSEQSLPQCRDGVCVLAWKPRKPNAA